MEKYPRIEDRRGTNALSNVESLDSVARSERSRWEKVPGKRKILWGFRKAARQLRLAFGGRAGNEQVQVWVPWVFRAAPLDCPPSQGKTLAYVALQDRYDPEHLEE